MPAERRKESSADTSQAGDAEGQAASPEAAWTPSRHELLIMATLSTTSLMVSLDASMIVTSLNAITIAIGGSATQGFWIGTSYLLATAITMPVIAAVSDVFGRPVCLEASLVLFTLGSVLCTAAQNIATMLVGRCIQGVGGGGIWVLGLVIFTDIVPLRHRPKWYGTVQLSWALGTCIGPSIGGAIAEHATWRLVFILLFPFCLAGLLAVPLLLTLRPRTASLSQRLARIDWLGNALFILSATAFLVAVSWGGTQYAWASAGTLVPLVLGVVGLAATCVWEAYYAAEPFLRRTLFWSASSLAGYFGAAMQGLVMFGQFYYVPFFLLAVKRFGPLLTGVGLLPVMITLVPSSILVGVLVSRWNRYRWAIRGGWAIVALGSAAIVGWSYCDATALWVTVLVVSGLGHGAVLNAQNFATQAMCRPGDEGAAAAMYGFLRQFGTALGVGVGGSTFQNVMALKLRWDGLDEAIARDAEAFVQVYKQMPDGVLKDKVGDAYRFGFVGVFAFYAGCAGLAFVVSLGVRHFDLDKELDTEHTLGESRMLGADGRRGEMGAGEGVCCEEKSRRGEKSGASRASP